MTFREQIDKLKKEGEILGGMYKKEGKDIGKEYAELGKKVGEHLKMKAENNKDRFK